MTLSLLPIANPARSDSIRLSKERLSAGSGQIVDVIAQLNDSVHHSIKLLQVLDEKGVGGAAAATPSHYHLRRASAVWRNSTVWDNTASCVWAAPKAGAGELAIAGRGGNQRFSLLRDLE